MSTTTSDTGAPWYLRLGAWVGIGTGPGALMSGGGAAEVTVRSLLWVALVLGGGLLTGLVVAHAIVGQRRNTPTVGLAAQAFGSRSGPQMVAVLIAVGTSLWTGFYIGIGSAAIGNLLDVPAAFGAVPIAVVLYGVYRAGFESWNVIVALTGAAALTVGVLVFFGVPESVAPPRMVAGSWPTVLVGAGVIVAYAAVFAVRVPDFTWDAPSSRDAVLGGITLIVTLMVFLVIGAGIFARTGSWELADLVNRTSLPVAGALLLVLSIIAPSVSGIHSAALAFEHLLGWPEGRGAAASVAVAAVLGATRFDLYLIPFLNLLGAVVPPVVSVLLLRTPTHRDRDAWIAWGAGATVSVAALSAGIPAHVLVSIVVSAAVMGLSWLTSKFCNHDTERAIT